MENKSTSNKDQAWRNAKLVKRLTKPLLQPGVINFKFADNILSRARNMIVPSPPVLMRLIQRRGIISDTGGGHLQIVNAQWVPNTKEIFFKKEEVDDGRLVQHTAQLKESTSESSSELPCGDLQSKSEESHLLSVKAVPQALHPENIYQSKSPADLQMKAVDSEAAAQAKLSLSAGTVDTVPRKKTSAGLSSNLTYEDLQSKSEESYLPSVKAVSQTLHSENIYKSKSPAELPLKAVASEAAAQGKPSLGAGTADTVQRKKISSGLSGNLTYEDFQSKSEGSPLPSVKAVSQTLHSENIYKSKSPAELQMKAVASEAVAQGKTTLSTGTANTVQRKKTSADLPSDVGYKNITSNSENVVISETGATILQRKECTSEPTAKPESISHPSIVTSNPIQKTIQQKGSASGLPRDILYEGIESNSKEQRVNKNKITASLGSETVQQADNTKWKIAGRGLPITKLSLPAILRKTNPDNLQFVSKKKDNNSSYSTSLAIKQKEVKDKVITLAEDKGTARTVSNDKIISGKTPYTERSLLLPESMLPTSIAMPIIRKKGDTSQKSSNHIVGRSFPETGIELKTEITPTVYSTSDRIHRAPVLIWRQSEGNTTPSSIFSRQPVHPTEKPISVSMDSTGKNMLSRSHHAVSSHESGLEANSMENIENNVSAQKTVSGGSGIDLSRIADQVSRILYRQLAVERERRGV